MSSTTSRLSLYKPAGNENINVSTDLNDNLDAIDLNIGFRTCTSTTRPSIVWDGLGIRETDTGLLYVSNGSAPASGSWIEVASNGANFTMTGTNLINLSGAASGTDKLAALVTGDTFDRFRLRSDGRMDWGSGLAARDTNLYRSAANVLKTDDVFSAQVETTTTGLVIATDFAANDFAARRSCGIATVYMLVTRTGATLTASSNGNIVGDPLMATLPSGWRPALDMVVNFDKGGVADGTAVISSSGQVVIKSLSPTATIANSDNIGVGATFVL